MSAKAVISLSVGPDQPARVTTAFRAAVGAAETGHDTLLFFTQDGVHAAVDGVAKLIEVEGLPPVAHLIERYEAAGGQYYVCSISARANQLSNETFLAGSQVDGFLVLWQCIGDDAATTFSF